jgi:hypothetical protein
MGRTETVHLDKMSAQHIYKILNDKGVWCKIYHRKDSKSHLSVCFTKAKQLNEIVELYNKIDNISSHMNPSVVKKTSYDHLMHIFGVAWTYMLYFSFLVLIPAFSWNLATEYSSSWMVMLGIAPGFFCCYLYLTDDKSPDFKFKIKTAAFIRNPFVDKEERTRQVAGSLIFLPIVSGGILFGLWLWHMILPLLQ